MEKQSNFDPQYLARLNVLQDVVCLRLDELFDALHVSLRKAGRMFMGACPIHGGDNEGALNLYHEGHTTKGNWRCNTRHCERTFKHTIIGFARGVLSHQKLNWDGSHKNKVLPFPETVDWLCQFVGTTLRNLKVDPAEIERRRYHAQVMALTGHHPEYSGITNWVPKSIVRKTLKRPSVYFLGRGYQPETLDFFDVGDYPFADRELSDRVAVPVYEDNGRMAAGFTGRSLYNQCPNCQLWHRSGLPCPKTKVDITAAVKWRHSKDFSTHQFLYNYWHAKEAIRETGTVILCEGPADVWRLHEAGVRNACALFGCELTDRQGFILQKSGAMTVVLLLDNDEPGRIARDNIAERLRRSYRIVCPSYDGHDIGGLSADQIQKVIS